MGLLACLLMTGCQSSARFESRNVKIPYACVCAAERVDATRIYQAIQREDRAAVLGMLARRKAMRLEKGVTVRTIGSVDGLTMIRVESGANIGERCWIPDRIVK